ncbi:hypothetical protein ACQBAU_01785 [Propionibacteriaceae bacterium Y2011]
MSEAAPITQYDVGMSTADVTPPVGGPLGGFAARARHGSTSVYHPLRAVATAIGDGERDVMIISVEWLGCYQLADRVRRAITQLTGIPASDIVLNASHTHCGPAVHETGRNSHGWLDDEYIDEAIGKIARAALRAYRHRNRCTISYALGHSDIATNRRLPDPENPPLVFDAMLPNPDGPVDHDVPVLVFRSVGDDTPRGLLFGYACHPTSRSGLAIGGDYVSFAMDHVDEAFPNAQVAFLQGCGGDAKPRPADPNEDGFGFRTVEQVKEIGDELGAAVVAAVADARPVTGPIAIQSVVEVLHTEPATREAVAEAAAAPEPFKQTWAEHWQGRLDADAELLTSVPFEIQTLTIGTSLAMITMAGEMTAEHALRLKVDHGDRYDGVITLGYTGAMVGYVSVRRQFEELGYEVLHANMWHLRSGRYVIETEDQIHARIAALLT